MENISLFKQGRAGVWFIQYRTADGIRKQKSTRCTRKADAVKVLSDFKVFLAEDQKPKSLPFSSFSQDFLKYAEGNFSAKTANIYYRTFRSFLRIVGDMDISKITAKHWDTFKTARKNEKVSLMREYETPAAAKKALEIRKPVSAVTVNIELKALRAAMSGAVRWKLIGQNPFEKMPLVTIPKTTPAFLTAEDAERLLSSITEDWLKDFVIFAINTGMRRGEILSLRWCDVDTEARVARITNRDDFTTKDGEERAVSLNDAALMVVNRRKVAAQIEYIFTCKHGKRLTADHATKIFKKAIKAAGLPNGLHLHSTRHSFASLLVGSGTSLFTVSKLLGHSNAKTSEIYSHLLPQHLHNEVDKITIGIGKPLLETN